MATASFVLGIISLVCGIFGLGLRPGGAVLGLIGIILSHKEKNEERLATAKAGRICSVVGLILCMVFFAVSLICAQIFHTVVGANLLEKLLTFLRELTA